MTFATEVVTFGDVELVTRVGTFDAEMAREIFEDRYYTCDGWDIPPSGTVLDLGGGIGAFAVFAAMNGAAEVFSFEPIPESYELATRNVALFPVTVEQAAVTTHNGIVRMSGFEPMPDGTINTGLPGISDEGMSVSAIDIHEVLARRERWHMVKIDIEGHEYELLDSLTADEFAKVDVITMEFHHDDEATTRERGLKLAQSLAAYGFVASVEWKWGLQGRLRARR